MLAMRSGMLPKIPRRRFSLPGESFATRGMRSAERSARLAADLP